MSRSRSRRAIPRSAALLAVVAVALLGWAPPALAAAAPATGELAGYRGSAGRPGWTVSPPLPQVPAGAVRLSHSEVERVVAGASTACTTGRGTTTTAAGYLRPFPLTEFGISGGFQVTAVSFTVESLTGAASPVSVHLYELRDPAGPFDYGNFDLLGTATHTPGPRRMAMVELPVSGQVPPGATLVVEVSTPDLTRGGFFIGADPGGSTAPSYLRAASCGLPAPTLTTDLGRPDLDLVMAVTGVPEPDGCDETITAEHPGPLTVAEGLTCLAPGARVTGEVNVLEGAGLRATDAVVQGPVATFGAATVELSGTQVVGPVAVRATTGAITLTGNQVTGSVLLVDNHTGATPAVVSGNLIVGSLFCTGNQPPPVDRGVPNDVVGGLKLDQCASL